MARFSYLHYRIWTFLSGWFTMASLELIFLDVPLFKRFGRPPLRSNASTFGANSDPPSRIRFSAVAVIALVCVSTAKARVPSPSPLGVPKAGDYLRNPTFTALVEHRTL